MLSTPTMVFALRARWSRCLRSAIMLPFAQVGQWVEQGMRP
jgi:hypothetical protein